MRFANVEGFKVFKNGLIAYEPHDGWFEWLYPTDNDVKGKHPIEYLTIRRKDIDIFYI